MLPAVKIEGNGKYIVSIVAESLEDFDACRGTIFVRGGSGMQYMSHSSIASNLHKEAKKVGMTFPAIPAVLGGGYIRVDSERKRVTLYGESIDFGKEPNRDQLPALLKENGFADFTIEICE